MYPLFCLSLAVVIALLTLALFRRSPFLAGVFALLVFVSRPMSVPRVMGGSPPFRLPKKVVERGGLSPTELAECESFIPFTRILRDDARTLQYHSRRGSYRPFLHWGQRKLLLSEIEFLTLFHIKGGVVVYVGAADGRHDPLLADMFPDMTLILYDPRDFAPQTVSYAKKYPERIQIRQQFFMDADVAEFRGRDDVLFVSDIRTMPEQPPGAANFRRKDDLRVFPSDEDVEVDMRRQERWIKEMRPAAFMIKMHPPYFKPGVPKEYTYLDGDIYLQAWAPQSSTETRLIGRRPADGVFRDKVYDVSWYENALFRFNTCTRIQPYEPLVETEDIRSVVELGQPRSYDILAEQMILKNYLEKIEGVKDENALRERLLALLEQMRRVLGETFRNKYSRNEFVH